jgi:hypothetical protein
LVKEEGLSTWTRARTMIRMVLLDLQQRQLQQQAVLLV